MSEPDAAPRAPQVALLDDYQGVATELARWSSLPAGSTLRSFRDHLAEEQALVERAGQWQTTLGMGLRGKTLGVLEPRWMCSIASRCPSITRC